MLLRCRPKCLKQLLKLDPREIEISTKSISARKSETRMAFFLFKTRGYRLGVKKASTLTYWRPWFWRLLPRDVCTNLRVPCEPAHAVPLSCVPLRGPSPLGEPFVLRATCEFVPAPPSLVSVLQGDGTCFEWNRLI